MRRFRALLAWYLFGLVAPAGGANRSFEGGVLCTGSRQELYSAAWIASTAMLAAFPIDRARLQRPGTGMEGATLILMELTHNQRVFKSVDLLELFMEHLSWYERDLRFFRAAHVTDDPRPPCERSTSRRAGQPTQRLFEEHRGVVPCVF